MAEHQGRAGLSFAQRVIRMRKQANPSLTDIELTGDGSQIASTVVKLAPDVETNDIRWPRASSLYSACMRMYVLGTKHMLKDKSWIGITMRVTYGIGKALHWWIQNTGDVLGNRRRGWFRCLA